MSTKNSLTQVPSNKKLSRYEKTFKYHLLSVPTVSVPTKTEAFTKAFVKPDVAFLEGWEYKLTFAKGDIDNLIAKAQEWRAKGEIDPDEYNTALNYLAENNLDSLVDELMALGTR